MLRCRPYMLELNCNCTKMSIIDITGILSFYDLTAKGHGTTQGEHLAFERKVREQLKANNNTVDIYVLNMKSTAQPVN